MRIELFDRKKELKIINAKTALGKFKIFIKPGLADNFTYLLRDFLKDCSKALIVTDDKVFSLYREKITNILIAFGFKYRVFKIKQGEEQKNIENTINIYKECIDFDMHRSDVIVAFGGGVVGDLAGFAASTFHRGINFIQFPTTIIGQIDRSIGGKVGVNFNKIKNVIGNFYQPKCILIDTLLLKSLEGKEIINGLGEMVKYGIIFDKKILKSLYNIANRLCKDGSDFLHKLITSSDFNNLIYKCCLIKTKVVIKDEFDTGYRNLLNFGHTFGHAIEKASAFSSVSHGAAVAIGMIIAADVSILAGFTNTFLRNYMLNLYKLLGLPNNIIFKNETERENFINEIITSMKFDKKFSSSTNKFILLKDLNKPLITSNIELEIIIKALRNNIILDNKIINTMNNIIKWNIPLSYFYFYKMFLKILISYYFFKLFVYYKFFKFEGSFNR